MRRPPSIERSRHASALTVLGALVLLACTPAPCITGASVGCVCTDGRAGAQICQADHTLGPCSCSGGADAGVDAAAADASTDAGTDAAIDVGHVPGDVGTIDVGDAAVPGVDAGDSGCVPPYDVTWDHRLPTEGVCSGSGWCWEIPALPIGSRGGGGGYTTVTAAGGVAWIGGGEPAGALLRYDGVHLRGIVGEIHPLDVAASAADEVWVLEASNHVWHYDGTTFTSPSLPTTFPLTEVGVASPTQAWLVGESAAVLRWNGATWSVVDTGLDPAYDVTALYVVGTDDVWIGSTDGNLRHYDGSSWTTRAAPDTTPNTIWASGTDLFVDGRRWTGAAWAIFPGRGYSAAPITRMAVASPSSMLLLVPGATSVNDYYWNGTSIDYGTPASPRVRDAIPFGAGFLVVSENVPVADGTLDVVATSPGTFASTFTPLAVRGNAPVRSIAAFGAHDVLAYGSSGASHRGDPATGTLPSAPQYQPPTAGTLIGVGGPSDVWFSGATGYARHFDGTSWTNLPISPTMPFVLGDANGSVYAQSGSTLYHFDGTAFVVLSSSAPPAQVLVPGFGSDVWTMPDPVTSGPPRAAFQRFDGTTWTTSSSITGGGNCVGLTASSPGHAFCFADYGRLGTDGTTVAPIANMSSHSAHSGLNGGVLVGNVGWVAQRCLTGGIVPSECEALLWTGCGADDWYQATGHDVFLESQSTLSVQPWTLVASPDGTFFRVENGAIVAWRH